MFVLGQFKLRMTLLKHRLARRSQNVIIGYHICSEEQARRYNEKGTLTDDGNRISAQIGPGVYTTPNPGCWLGSSLSWYCVILADSDALDRVSKVWVPQTYGGSTLWYHSDDVDSYIQTDINFTWNPAKTLRMSIVDGNPDQLQLVIPPGLLNSNGGAMGNIARCDPQIVDYDSWQNNIDGSRTNPYPDGV
ncbi:hypothetical protein V8F33_012812 [Rhypophila sp. PSN 637]